ncbi:MAG: alanine racemase [PVC group bacterium]|nr:alanine racemase [PVC group bacterium]
MMSNKNKKQIAGYRPTWVEINLANLRFNFRQVKKLVGKQVKMIAAVKANAYGHGMIEVARVLEKCGVDYFGVACVDEANSLAKAKIKTPALILGAISTPAEIKQALKLKAIITVPDYRTAKMISRYAGKYQKSSVHIKIDTGMGRLGVWHEQALGFIEKVVKLKNLKVEGIYTHFPSSDTDRVFTIRQVKAFARLVHNLKEKNINIPFVHAANSSAVCSLKNSYLSMVRPGIMLYGMYPDQKLRRYVKLKPVLSFKTKVVYLKTVESGRSISYGRTYITKHRTKIATIPVGYADGYTRALSNKANVLVRNRLAPIAGRVCMDQTMVDVGHIPDIKIGDTVILIGQQRKKRISAESLATISGTIAYEIACWIPTRVRRIFKH